MKITKTNKEFGYTIEYSCSECGNVIVPAFFCKYGDTVHFDFDAIKFCSCGADLRCKFVHEVLSDERMIELTIHESFPLKDDNKYIDVVASIAKQWGVNCVGLSPGVYGIPATFEFVFYCVNKCDNPNVVAADGHRWIMSALVVVGVLPGCGWKQVGGFIDTFHIDERDPRVVVRIG